MIITPRNQPTRKDMAIRKDQILGLTGHVFNHTHKFLAKYTNIDPVTAYCLAKDAADAFGNALLRDCPENGVEVKP